MKLQKPINAIFFVSSDTLSDVTGIFGNFARNNRGRLQSDIWIKDDNDNPAKVTEVTVDTNGYIYVYVLFPAREGIKNAPVIGQEVRIAGTDTMGVISEIDKYKYQDYVMRIITVKTDDSVLRLPEQAIILQE